MGIIINKAEKENLNNAMTLVKDLDLNLIGTINQKNEINYDELAQNLEVFYPRMNLPQIETE